MFVLMNLGEFRDQGMNGAMVNTRIKINSESIIKKILYIEI